MTDTEHFDIDALTARRNNAEKLLASAVRKRDQLAGEVTDAIARHAEWVGIVFACQREVYQARAAIHALRTLDPHA